jgi:hypothetical protein
MRPTHVGGLLVDVGEARSACGRHAAWANGHCHAAGADACAALHGLVVDCLHGVLVLQLCSILQCQHVSRVWTRAARATHTHTRSERSDRRLRDCGRCDFCTRLESDLVKQHLVHQTGSTDGTDYPLPILDQVLGQLMIRTSWRGLDQCGSLRRCGRCSMQPPIRQLTSLDVGSCCRRI